jgi:uncharacterized protein (DUF1499 family)
MVTRIAMLGAFAFALGPVLAWLGIVRPLMGFALFALGGLLGIVTLVWGSIALLRGTASGLAAALGLVITVVLLAVAVPSRSYPPYNDFTTDTEDPPAFQSALTVDANRGRDMGYPGGEVTAAQREAYPDLVPLRLTEPPARAFERVRDATRRMAGWEITSEDPQRGTIEGVATTGLFRFRDDFVIRIRPDGSGSRIDMRSKSRDGRGDIGANAKRIRAFFAVVQDG